MRYKIEVRDMWELGQRTNQEDSLFPAHNEAQESNRLFILCDGMGGHEKGEVASSTVCEAMSQSILKNCPDDECEFNSTHLQEAIDAAFDALDAQDPQEPGKKKMGTTMTLLKFHNQGCTIAHMGDSRVYHIRPGKEQSDTEILFQTVDHSLVNDLIKAGEMTPEEAKTSNVRNVITRAMQPHMNYKPKAQTYHTNDIRPGDYFMLCSDGVLEQFEDEHIKFYFAEDAGDIDTKIEKLTLATQYNHDNHTAILVHIVDVNGNSPKVEPISNNDDIVIDIVDNESPIVPQTPQDKTTTRPKKSFTPDNKQIAIATAILIIIIALFLLFKGCENRKNNGEKNITDTITSVTPTADMQEQIEQLEREKRAAEEQKRKAEIEAQNARKELEEVREKAIRDSIEAVQKATEQAQQPEEKTLGSAIKEAFKKSEEQVQPQTNVVEEKIEKVQEALKEGTSATEEANTSATVETPQDTTTQG